MVHDLGDQLAERGRGVAPQLGHLRGLLDGLRPGLLLAVPLEGIGLRVAAAHFIAYLPYKLKEHAEELDLLRGHLGRGGGPEVFHSKIWLQPHLLSLPRVSELFHVLHLTVAREMQCRQRLAH